MSMTFKYEYLYLEILKEVEIEDDEKINILHQLGKYETNNQKLDEEVGLYDKKDEIDDILNEYNEDDFNKFEELDEDL